jgi:hypothetical protein
MVTAKSVAWGKLSTVSFFQSPENVRFFKSLMAATRWSAGLAGFGSAPKQTTTLSEPDKPTASRRSVGGFRKKVRGPCIFSLFMAYAFWQVWRVHRLHQ